MNFLAQKRSKILIKDIQNTHRPTPPVDDFYYKEIAQLTAAGGFSVDFQEKTSFLDPEARRILRTPSDYRASLNGALEFFAEDHREAVLKAFQGAAAGKSYKGTIKMLTYDKKEFWARAIGKAVFNSANEVIGFRGVFQDISEAKEKELDLESSLKVIESQNTRLFNFANTVSHNLRSHASNLQLTAELLASAESVDEEKELKQNLNEISENITTTIRHLNEIVAIQVKAGDDKKVVSFRETLLRVMHAIQNLIFTTETEIFSDFSEVPEIPYIPAYMESIFHNLITNAIKFKHPHRKPVIDICTYKDEEGHTHLMVKDNGLGIDLERFGSKLFHIYETFHSKEHGAGVGLFITKNQVEALQGVIEVESTVNIGTTFTIRFAQ
ncbi:MAG: PAS domain-containing sensor histidine kinase [Altibacter sp.]|uniref:sensor histidine kinase n=1 Tax=Altibacter lentus TaxID=1223410 RepID=UPI000689C959|nr:PAS domain-containing sensor histidine kinase [Altibacter lentus]MCW8980964.1 PAS domain-containing sensor histidine kinase [Altibacter sp.]